MSSATAITVKLLAVVLLVAANGFFVAAEFALVGVRSSRIETLVAQGSRSAKRLMQLLQNLNAYLSACQLGITLASLALGWIGEPAVAGLLAGPLSGLSETLRHGIAFAIAFSIITSLHIVLGEQAPKLMGLALAERVALAVALPMQLFYRVFSLPIRALDWASARTVKLIGLEASAEHASTYTEEELRRLVDISRESGHLRAEERRLIHRVFEFSDTVVREAMVPRTEMAAIPSTCNLEEITKAFDQHRYSRLPVYRESFDDVIGFVHSKDVMPYLLHPNRFKLEDVLQPPLYVVDTARLEHVLRQMQKAKMHFGFVVDEHGGLEGIITLEDLLEEIVGDISDEHDEEVNEQITEIDQHTYVLDGGLAVRDLNRRLKLTVPESEGYTTVGGFLMTEAGHVLKPGEVVQHDGLVFKIERVEKRRVMRVKLEIQQTDGEGEIENELDRARSGTGDTGLAR
ncbi:MAG TPA: hemolysin family protein [Pyrinomonadaceae bacterium]|jgi:CBS domain containing-hemolysin-like protein|nr:hemolysin family protein [Pyrinomonadaceae bacterium]